MKGGKTLLPLRGILCPGCGTPSSRVVNSRPVIGAQMRRHECTRCGGRWTTYETVSGFKRGERR